MNADENKSETILVATDFSAASASATDLAVALATLRGARVCLLHVFEPPSIMIPDLALDPDIEHVLRERASEQLATAATAIRAVGIAVDQRLEVGSPPQEIIANVASEIGPILVAVGTHGRRLLPRLLMGSVAEATLLRIKQPVVVVPEGMPAPRHPPGEHRWRIAVGIDLSASGAAAIDWVRELRRHADCDVVFIHLYWPVAEYARFGLPGPRDLFKPDAVTIDLLGKSLLPLIGTLPGKGETAVRVLPNWGPTGERLVREATQERADLLVLGTNGRHGFSRLLHGSTVPPAVHANIVPILCVSQTQQCPVEQPIPHLRHILAATDLSDFGYQAIVHAYALARGERGAVHLLYVHERSMSLPAFVYPPSTTGELTVAETNELRARLHAQVPAQATSLGIATEVIISDGGSAAEVICQTAERLGVDAISLGSHGRGGLGGLVMGSVAARVLHQTSRPVFVVRSHS